jgi:hypothetical protein
MGLFNQKQSANVKKTFVAYGANVRFRRANNGHTLTVCSWKSSVPKKRL